MENKELKASNGKESLKCILVLIFRVVHNLPKAVGV